MALLSSGRCKIGRSSDIQGGNGSTSAIHARFYTRQQTGYVRSHLPSRGRASRTLVQAPVCYKANGNGNSSASVTEHVTERRAQEIPSPPDKKEDIFVWSKQWYPLAAVEDLNPSKPFATKLLGKDMVIWRDGEQQWRCFEDKCPHRLAPLSQGRIEPSDGTLQCSYHGWRFAGSGQAAAIPQAAHDSPQAEKTSCSSKRSCVATYPTQVELGLVWVWPESSPEAWIESAAQQPAFCPLVKDLDPEKVGLTTNQNYIRDFPVAYDILFENISDQSHVPFAHNGVAYKRASQWATHFEITDVNKNLKAGEAYTYDLEWSPDAVKPPIKQNVRAVPPAYIEYFTPKEDGKFTALWFYVVPLDEHSTRVINHAVIVQPLPKLVKKLAAARPRWIDHLLLNEIFDGDMAYLAKASENAKQRDGFGATWAQDYYLPAKADGSVLAWRKWFHKQGQSGYWRQMGREATPAPDLAREQLLDRYHQHTKSCSACSKNDQGLSDKDVIRMLLQALKQLQTGRKVLLGAAAILGLATAARLGQGAHLISVGMLSLILGALLCLWLSEKFAGWQSKFLYSDYDHTAKG